MENEQNAFGGMLSIVEANAKSAIPINEGDYVLDGLWYCHKCNTPKQCRIELFGRIRTPMCLCKCEKEKKDEEEAEQKRRERLERIEDLRKAGFTESNMRNWTFSNDDGANPKITNVALKYVENYHEMQKHGKGLLFYGNTGTGKTFFSACIANALIDRGYPCLVTNFSRLVNTISGMYTGKQEYIDSLNRFDLLVIDDLAVERDTEYMNENVQNIIDCRYRAGLPIIITTNLTNEEIKNPAEIHRKRAFSRLLEMCIPIEVVGIDRRRNILRHDHEELKDLLGL